MYPLAKLKLIYHNSCPWEKHYIRELFGNIQYDIINVDHQLFDNKLDKEDEIVNNNILVFSSNAYQYKQILNFVLRVKPLIIIHLSDEWGRTPNYTHLAAHTKLFLHQYHSNNYPYNNYKNVIQIPLGYMTGMFGGKNSLDFKIKPLLERKYTWSFVGNIKKDRPELLNKFSKRFTRKFVGKNIKANNMLNIYNDSIFVPNGRGNVTVDCFRIYEAILSGSIPVIVCNPDEYKNAFYYNNDIPPFIFEKSWDDAVNKCEHLLNNIELLKITQQQNYNWLRNKIISIQDIICSTLNI